jgi:hypothetical protein
MNGEVLRVFVPAISHGIFMADGQTTSSVSVISRAQNNKTVS